MFKNLYNSIRFKLLSRKLVRKRVEEVEEGLQQICKRWIMIAPLMAGSPIEKFGINKIYNLVIRGVTSYQLHVRHHDASFLSGISDIAHATVELDERTWLEIFRGEINLGAAINAGRGYVQSDQQNTVFALGLIFSTLANI